MSDFEYWYLPKSDNVTTRINRCFKFGKYIVFVRDDGKQCRYDLSSGEVIGFRGKPVKRLNSQLKDLTCGKLIEITEDPIYKQFFSWVWRKRHNGKAWVFFEYTMPLFKDYQQFFVSGISNVGYDLDYTYKQIPKGLIRLCRTNNDICLNNKLAKTYIENPNVFNVLENYKLKKSTVSKMVEAIVYGCGSHARFRGEVGVINPNDLTQRKGPGIPAQNYVGTHSYFVSLVRDYGYNPKMLISYADSDKIKKKLTKSTFQYIYDYADMMTQMYDDFDRYPEKMNVAHKKACEEFNRLNIEYDDEEYRHRSVKDYECQIDGFKFIYPNSTKDIKEEAKNQHNCVATYINRVLNEKCHIMFMRPVDKPDESYITLEIRYNQIVQAKRKYNQDPSKKEQAIIDKWNEKYREHWEE